MLDRKTELTDSLKNLKPHDHLCLIYENEEQWKECVVPFLVAGLKKGEKCFYIVDRRRAEDVIALLKAESVDADKLIENGQLVILHEYESYTKEGSFDPDRMIEMLKSEVKNALSQGYKSLRVTGEMSWALKGITGSERIIEYEYKLNSDLFPFYPCTAICQYDRRLFDPDIIKGVIETHPLVINRNAMYENFYFIPPERLIGIEKSEAEVNFWLENLQKNYLFEKEYRTFFNATPDMVFLKDSELKYLIANKVLQEFSGKSMKELRGKTDADILPHPVAKQCEITDREALSKGRLVKNREVAGDRVYETYKFPVTLEKGEIGVGGFIRDVTNEEAYLENLKSYEILFHNANDNIFFVRASDYRILDANEAAIETYGYSIEEMRELKIADIRSPDSRGEIDEQLQRAFREGLPYETNHIKKDGTVFPVEISTKTASLKGEDVIVSIIRDITERKKSEEMIHKSLITLLNALSKIVEIKDPYTAGHQRRVGELACAIADRLGQEERRIENIRISSLLHDIGKISVPTEILSKPGKLSEIEFSLVKMHSVTGYDFLQDVDFGFPVATIVRQHHERLDGSGYPDGLKGDQITLEAQIIGLADVVEAMASHRPYRAALGLENALAEISSKSGTLFDSKLVNACLEVFEEGFVFHD